MGMFNPFKRKGLESPASDNGGSWKPESEEKNSALEVSGKRKLFRVEIGRELNDLITTSPVNHELEAEDNELLYEYESGGDLLTIWLPVKDGSERWEKWYTDEGNALRNMKGEKVSVNELNTFGIDLPTLNRIKDSFKKNASRRNQ